MHVLKQHYSISYRIGGCLVGLLGLICMPLLVEAADCTAYTLIGYETAGGAVKLTDIQAGDCPTSTDNEHATATVKEATATGPTTDQYILAGFFTLLTVLLVRICIAISRTYPGSGGSLKKDLSPSKPEDENK